MTPISFLIYIVHLFVSRHKPKTEMWLRKGVCRVGHKEALILRLLLRKKKIGLLWRLMEEAS